MNPPDIAAARASRRFVLGIFAVALLLVLSACTSDTSADTTDLSPEQAEGLALAQRFNCTGCHTSDGSKSVGPTWKGLYGSEVTLDDGSVVTADDAYLRRAIEDPGAQVAEGFRAMMPKQDLTGDDMTAVIVYIKSLAN